MGNSSTTPLPHQHSWLGCLPSRLPYLHIIWGEGAGWHSLSRPVLLPGSPSLPCSPTPNFVAPPWGPDKPAYHSSCTHTCVYTRAHTHHTHLSSQSVGVAEGRLGHGDAWVCNPAPPFSYRVTPSPQANHLHSKLAFSCVSRASLRRQHG